MNVKLWRRILKERRDMRKSLKRGEITLKTLCDFYRLLALNEVSRDDKFAMYLGMSNQSVYQFAFGQKLEEAAGPVMKIYIYVVPGNGSIRVEINYNNTTSKTITENLEFKDNIDVDHIRDDRPNNFYFTADRVDTIKNVICNSMLYTLHSYIRRWY